MENSTLSSRPAGAHTPASSLPLSCRNKGPTNDLRQAEFEHRGELLGWYRSDGITNYLEGIVRIDFLRGFHQIRMRLFENPVRETLLTQIRNTVFRHGRGTAIDEHLTLQFCDCQIGRIRPRHSLRSEKSAHLADASRTFVFNQFQSACCVIG